MDLNGVIDFIESQDDDAFALTSCEISFEDDLCLGRVTLQFCEDIVTRPANFAPQSKDANTETVTDHQSEIIMYITGAVLHKLKKWYARSNRSDDLDVIKGLISHENKGPRPSLIEGS
ncbi:hypothetical protein CAPTEDRAFT_210942 [Capitella teleta]|uniref:Uncharacterized protein n=1 Tax=Capitella teleta TaxID=283909 RepID=R7TNE4_CAPTE|nr:hypothetical protein CAPTEDRAFT_210942 [Capitella teleta]|eukprot:ELT95067.1 hypothetical protein CAPTEDRAFT_210942 [Capitella teleta]